MEELLAKIQSLEALISQLQAENKQLRAQNADLDARLPRNSTNSSKPPATDSLQKKPVKPAPAEQEGRKPDLISWYTAAGNPRKGRAKNQRPRSAGPTGSWRLSSRSWWSYLCPYCWFCLHHTQAPV